MGLRWKDEDNAAVREHWPDAEKIARIIGRSVAAVVKRAFHFRLAIRPSGNWTDEDLKTLRDHWHEGVAAVGRRIKRSPGAVLAMAQRLHMKQCDCPWTDEHITILERRWQGPLSVATIAALVNRTPEAVLAQARRLGLSDAARSKGAVLPDVPPLMLEAMRLLRRDGPLCPYDLMDQTGCCPFSIVDKGWLQVAGGRAALTAEGELTLRALGEMG